VNITGIGEVAVAEKCKVVTPTSVSVVLFLAGAASLYFYYVGHDHGIKYSKARVRDGYKL